MACINHGTSAGSSTHHIVRMRQLCLSLGQLAGCSKGKGAYSAVVASWSRPLSASMHACAWACADAALMQRADAWAPKRVCIYARTLVSMHAVSKARMSFLPASPSIQQAMRCVLTWARLEKAQTSHRGSGAHSFIHPFIHSQRCHSLAPLAKTKKHQNMPGWWQ